MVNGGGGGGVNFDVDWIKFFKGKDGMKRVTNGVAIWDDEVKEVPKSYCWYWK